MIVLGLFFGCLFALTPLVFVTLIRKNVIAAKLGYLVEAAILTLLTGLMGVGLTGSTDWAYLLCGSLLIVPGMMAATIKGVRQEYWLGQKRIERIAAKR